MANDSFKEQFPEYQLLPEKRAWSWTSVTIVLVSFFAVGGTIAVFFYEASRTQLPTPNMLGFNSMTASTAKNMAIQQAEAGNHGEAVENFKIYFNLGGNEAEPMAVYASSLAAIGQKALALEWSRKAIKQDPQSKAARFVNDNLEKE